MQSRVAWASAGYRLPLGIVSIGLLAGGNALGLKPWPKNLLSVSHVTYGLAPPSAAINAHRQMIVTFFNTRVPQLI